MRTPIKLGLLSLLAPVSLYAQIGKVTVPPGADSVKAGVHPSYNDVSGVHRLLFGENYRKDWAMPVNMPGTADLRYPWRPDTRKGRRRHAVEVPAPDGRFR